MPAVLRDYTPVTEARLQSPNDGDWMMNRRTYDGWGYSPLTQITAANVARLKPVWSFSTGAINGHEAAPIVHDGVMFVATPGSQVIAIEAATGAVLWRYRRPLAPTVINRHPTTRGVGLLGDKVFLAASDAVLMALDARTGRTVWSTTVADNRAGHYMSLAPLVADGKVHISTENATLWVLAAGRQKQVLGDVELNGSALSTPVAANGVLYVMTARSLYAARQPKP
jgi:alcohol dehydrogenase (cytochrome c)